MVALDVSAAGGYTTELLARAIGPTGRVYGQSPPRDPKRPPAPAQPEGAAAPTAWAHRQRPPSVARRAARGRIRPSRWPSAAKNPEREQHRRRRADLRESGAARHAQTNSLDLVTLMFNYHDLGFLGVDRARMNRAVLRRAEAGRHVCDRRPFGATGHGHFRIGHAASSRGSVPAQRRSRRPDSSSRPEGNFMRNPSRPARQEHAGAAAAQG